MRLVLVTFICAFIAFTCLGQASNDQLFTITVDGKAGYINKQGQVILKPVYEQAGDFADGLAPVKINGKWGLIDRDGKILIEPRFDEIRWSFQEELASVKVGDKWGYIDKSGNSVIEPTLEYGHLFEDGRAIINITRNGGLHHGIIDKTGKLITEQLFEWSGWSFSEGLLNVKIDGKWGFIDRDGKMVIPAQYKDALEFSEGLAAVEFSDDKNQWGFIDKTGNAVIPPQFGDASYFKEGLAVISKEWKYGFVNKQGQVIIEPQFDHAYSFSDGLAAMRIKGKWGFIGKSGEIRIKPKYDLVWPFAGGLASVSFGKWKGNPDPHRLLPSFIGKWGYIDQTGKVIWKPSK